MRSVLIAAALLSTGAASEAQQRVVMHGPGAGQPMASGHVGQHWGGRVQGHWVGGMRAPGGWASYHRPYRGFRLPSYWISPSFYLVDWAGYGLPQPPAGYSWSRYYDDAVLIDTRGAVYDTVGGIPWDQYDLDEAEGGQIDAYNANTDSYYASRGAPYAQPAYPPQGGGYAPQGGGYAPQDGYAPGAGYAPPPPQDGGYREHRSNGVGGAIAGAAVGGIAGGLIAGRHDKVGGALIGAGAGALAGLAIDRSSHRHDRDRGDYAPPPPYAGGPGAPYPVPGGPGAYAPPTVISSGGGTTVTTTTSGGVPSGTYVNGYYYPPATVTTVTVASAPVVTTTTEVWEDNVTYSRPVVRKVYRRRIVRPRCGCR